MRFFSKACLYLVLILSFVRADLARAQLADPNFVFEIAEFEELTADSHADTYRIILGKPVQSLTLSMMSSGVAEDGDQHLPGTQILLDLSTANVSNMVNSTSELSFSATFDPPLSAGEYLATRVVFGYIEGYFHSTVASASGFFADGSSFMVLKEAGFVPEPTSALLCLMVLSFATCSRAPLRAPR